MAEVDNAGGRSLKMLEWMLFIVHHLFVHFRISSSLSFKRKTERNVFLLLFVLTPVHLNWPSYMYATGKCYRSPRQLISTMTHWWLYITIHSLTIFKWNMRIFKTKFNIPFFFCSVYFNQTNRALHVYNALEDWWSMIWRNGIHFTLYFTTPFSI